MARQSGCDKQSDEECFEKGYKEDDGNGNVDQVGF